MAQLLGNGIFHVARGVENLSVRVGVGNFEVGDGYKCIECHSTQTTDKEICFDCRMSWLNEIGHIEYSDAFERRCNIILGSSMLVIGFTAMAANECLGGRLWVEKEGGAVQGIAAFFKNFIPSFLTLSQGYMTYAAVAFITLHILALLTLIVSLIIPCFMMCINPTASRHWRHFTPSAMAVTVLFFVAEMWFVFQGVTMADILLVVWPMCAGVYGLTLLRCMRKNKGKEGDRIEEIDGEEKTL